MRLSGTNELVAIAVVILVTCFSPSLVGPLVQSKVGKAVALAATAWVALNVSQPLALFLAVLVVSCCSKEGLEYLKMPEEKDKKKPDAAGSASM
jgi:hypothetical protein